MHACHNLRKLPAHFYPATETQKTGPSGEPAHQPPQPIKSEDFPLREKVARSIQLITLDKPNAHEPRYKVRRKPVPRLSDLPSSPTPRRGERKDAVGEGVLNSFPALDSGSFDQHYQVDPEELEVPQEMRIHNLIIKKMLGIGGQGKVYLAQGPTVVPEATREEGKDKEAKQMVFAVKVMIKNRHAQYDDILQEQKLLRRLRGNRFLLQLEGSFHDEKNFYLITVCLYVFSGPIWSVY